jgi:hypothetical protein
MKKIARVVVVLVEGSHQYKLQLNHSGHPSKPGFKEVINDWKTQTGVRKNLLHSIKGSKQFSNYNLIEFAYLKPEKMKKIIFRWIYQAM